MIAHRLSTIKSADRIICMDHGKVAETGTFEELMKKKRIFKKNCLENSEDMKIKGNLNSSPQANPLMKYEKRNHGPLYHTSATAEG